MNSCSHPRHSTTPSSQHSTKTKKIGESHGTRIYPLWLRILPLVALIGVIGTAFALDLDSYLSLETLRNHRNGLTAWVENAGFLASLAYLAVYIGVVLMSLPGPIFVTLAGGFLFGAVQATFLTMIGATIGATIVFLIARNALGETLRQRAGPIIRKIEAGFQKNGVTYMLMLRLVPVFPFGLVNIAAAVLGVRLSIFVVTTAIGIIPAVFVVSLSGVGLDLLLQSNEEFSLGNILSPPVIATLIGFAALASVPILYKHLRGPSVQRQHKTRRGPQS